MQRNTGRFFVVVLILSLIAFGVYFRMTRSVPSVSPPALQSVPRETVRQELPLSTPTSVTLPTPTPSEAPVTDSSQRDAKHGERVTRITIKQSVPFLVQAPGGTWANPVFQGGCEEASLIMADAWVRGVHTLDAVLGKALIQKMSGYAEETYGKRSYDTSVVDTVKVAKHFFPDMKVEAEMDVSLQTIIDHVERGVLVIAPMDGQRLSNPHFTAPGPEHHMLVIIGYDAITHEFITNDPGTRYGEGYRYPEKTSYQAIRGYPTGDHLIVETVRKNILIISKK